MDEYTTVVVDVVSEMLADEYCNTCKAPIWWMRTHKGKPVPLDRVPSRRGNFVMAQGIARAPTDNDRRQKRLRLYTCHFVTCPNPTELIRPPRWTRPVVAAGRKEVGP